MATTSLLLLLLPAFLMAEETYVMIDQETQKEQTR